MLERYFPMAVIAVIGYALAKGFVRKPMGHDEQPSGKSGNSNSSSNRNRSSRRSGGDE